MPIKNKNWGTLNPNLNTRVKWLKIGSGWCIDEKWLLQKYSRQSCELELKNEVSAIDNVLVRESLPETNLQIDIKGQELSLG